MGIIAMMRATGWPLTCSLTSMVPMLALPHFFLSDLIFPVSDHPIYARSFPRAGRYITTLFYGSYLVNWRNEWSYLRNACPCTESCAEFMLAQIFIMAVRSNAISNSRRCAFSAYFYVFIYFIIRSFTGRLANLHKSDILYIYKYIPLKKRYI